MQFWPVAWIPEIPLQLLMLLFFFSIFSYKIVIVVATIVLIIMTPTILSFMVKVAIELCRLIFRRRQTPAPPRKPRTKRAKGG